MAGTYAEATGGLYVAQYNSANKQGKLLLVKESSSKASIEQGITLTLSGSPDTNPTNGALSVTRSAANDADMITVGIAYFHASST